MEETEHLRTSLVCPNCRSMLAYLQAHPAGEVPLDEFADFLQERPDQDTIEYLTCLPKLVERELVEIDHAGGTVRHGELPGDDTWLTRMLNEPL